MGLVRPMASPEIRPTAGPTTSSAGVITAPPSPTAPATSGSRRSTSPAGSAQRWPTGAPSWPGSTHNGNLIVIREAGSSERDPASCFPEFALAPGTYKLTPQPMSDQMMRAPEGKSVTLGGTAPETAIIDFTYDTGIR